MGGRPRPYWDESRRRGPRRRERSPLSGEMARSLEPEPRPDTGSAEKPSSNHLVRRPTQPRRSKIVSPNQTNGGGGWGPPPLSRDPRDPRAPSGSPSAP